MSTFNKCTIPSRLSILDLLLQGYLKEKIIQEIHSSPDLLKNVMEKAVKRIRL